MLVFPVLGGIPRAYDLSWWIKGLEFGQGWGHLISASTIEC
jgi:hypothetical protein